MREQVKTATSCTRKKSVNFNSGFGLGCMKTYWQQGSAQLHSITTEKVLFLKSTYNIAPHFVVYNAEIAQD